MKKSKKEKSWKNFDKSLKEENKELKNWITRNYGKRCKEYVKECYACEAWKMFDKLRHEIV